MTREKESLFLKFQAIYLQRSSIAIPESDRNDCICCWIKYNAKKVRRLYEEKEAAL